MKITQHSVTTAAPPPAGRSQTFYWDDYLRGFGLCMSAKGRRSWVVQARIRRTHRVRRVVLGQWPAMTVEQARAAARPLLLEFAAGRDPVAEEPKPVVTFGEFIPIYLDHAKAHRRSWRQDAGALRRYLPEGWKARRLDSFTPGDMAALHTQLGEHRGHHTANAFVRVARAMFNRARDWGYLPEATLNPCRKIEWFREHARERYLAPDEYDRLQAALDAEPIPLWRDYFQMLLLTAQRKSEVAGMRWTEIDLDAAVWTIPAERTKSKRLTRVPLTQQALDILRARAARPANSPCVFPAPQAPDTPVCVVKTAWQRIKRRAGLPDDVRPHDLRRTVASYAAADGTSLAVIGKLLNHSRPDTTQIYARLDLGPVREALQRQQDRLDARRNGHANGALPFDATRV